MLARLLRKDLVLNGRVLWGIAALLAWLAYALREPDLSFVASAMIAAFAGTLAATMIGAREDKFKALTLLHSLPVTRAAVVQARYVSAVIVGMATFAIVAVMALVLPWSSHTAGEVLNFRTALFACAFVPATAIVMLPFAIRFGMVGVVGLLAVFQVFGIVGLLIADLSGRRELMHLAFGSVARVLRAAYGRMDDPAFILLTAAVLAASAWVSTRLSVFLVDRQEF
jgi:hypothetical protein